MIIFFPLHLNRVFLCRCIWFWVLAVKARKLSVQNSSVPFVRLRIRGLGALSFFPLIWGPSAGGKGEWEREGGIGKRRVWGLYD